MKNIINIVLIILCLICFIPETIKTEDNSQLNFSGFCISIFQFFIGEKYLPGSFSMPVRILLPSNKINNFNYYIASNEGYDTKIENILLQNGGINLLYIGFVYDIYCCNYNFMTDFSELHDDKIKDSLINSSRLIETETEDFFNNCHTSEIDCSDKNVQYYINIYEINAVINICNCKKINSSDTLWDTKYQNSYSINKINSLKPITAIDSIKFNKIFTNILNYK